MGYIMKISRFCTDDGPGIRTVVFLKGCPLKCIWCHNPESQKKVPEIMYDSKKCIGCKSCYKVCKNGCHSFDKNTHVFVLSKCIACGKCSEVCPTDAIELVGKNISADEVLKEIERDSVFYQTSNGGVTISGGEPLYQPDFTIEILKRCKEKGIHTAIETSGFSDRSTLKRVLQYCDLVLYDIKETDEKKHKKVTGVPLKPILENINTISQSGIPFIIRLPIVPGINDKKNHFYKVKNIIKNINICKGVEIMPYHMLGAYKYDLLQRKNLCSDIIEPTDKMIDLWKSFL